MTELGGPGLEEKEQEGEEGAGAQSSRAFRGQGSSNEKPARPLTRAKPPVLIAHCLVIISSVFCGKAAACSKQARG